MMNSFEELTNCVACGSHNLVPVLDLGDQPLANSFKLEQAEVQPEYPLAINHCADCFHVQLTHAVDPSLMFKDYLYVSGTSKTMHDHMEQFAEFAATMNNNYDLTVLDVGCNDGTQLDYFKKMGYTTYGVDPAENLVEGSRSKGHNIRCGWFDDSAVEWMKGIKPGLITAQNVFAHTKDPLGFLETAKKLMAPCSLLIVQTSQADMIINNEFDTIYHEHISFFNARSMDALCRRAGLHLLAVEFAPIHGNSYVFTISTQEHNPNVNSNAQDVIQDEALCDLYHSETYVEYAGKCRKIAEDFVEYLGGRGGKGSVIGCGAPAKGMTFLNYCRSIDPNIGNYIDFITDNNPLKQGRFTPGTSIPIYGEDRIESLPETDSDTNLFIPLAWNFYDEIVTKIKDKRPGKHDQFLTYFPEIKISD